MNNKNFPRGSDDYKAMLHERVTNPKPPMSNEDFVHWMDEQERTFRRWLVGVLVGFFALAIVLAVWGVR